MELAAQLIRAHADVNKIDEDGKTEIYYAVEYGRRKMVKLLIDSGASTNIPDKDGVTPLQIASQRSIHDQRHEYFSQKSNGKQFAFVFQVTKRLNSYYCRLICRTHRLPMNNPENQRTMNNFR